MQKLWTISCILLFFPLLMAKKHPEKKQQVLPDLNETANGTVNKNSVFTQTYSLTAHITDALSATLRLDASVTPPSGKANLTCPVLFTIQQGEHIESFYLPRNTTYGHKDKTWFVHYKGGKSICFHKSSNGVIENKINLMISTCDERDTNFSFNLVGYNNSYLLKEFWQDAEISPVSSRFYPFRFSQKRGNDVVLVEVRSKDDTCMTVSVQSPQCPVADQEDTVHYKGKRKNLWQTMSTVALIPVTKDDFPNGFVLVFVVHTENERCKQYKGINPSADELSVQTLDEPVDSKLKNIRFIINEDLPKSAYVYPVFLPLAFYFALIGFALFLFVLFYRCTIFCLDRESRRRPSMQVVFTRNPIMTVSETMSNRSNSIDSSTSSNATHFSETPMEADETRILRSRFNPNRQQSNPNGPPCVTDLEDHANCQKLGQKSYKYYWIVLTIAIFYCVPVFQLLNTYEQILERTGDSDLCYYNYQCAHPLGNVIDFNHIYSNIGYVILGIYFNLLVYYKEKLHLTVKEGLQRMAVARSDARDPIPQQNYGTIQHFGIYYALGFSLIMEGVLSAAYHVCPNRSNFQFDTSFMYVIAVLYMLKIYQFRHPVKINANTTFAVLAVIAMISVLGLLVSQIAVAIAFSLIHLTAVFYIQIYMYYVGYIKDEDGETVTDRAKLVKIVRQKWKNMHREERWTTWFVPRHLNRILLPILTVPFNFGVIFLYFFHVNNFATHLLYIFVGNLLLYLTYYILMKAIHLEFINLKSIHPLIYIPLTVVLWVFALQYFTKVLSTWEKSPAESRQDNEECFLMDFYDQHDMWHFLSAGALFCSFMMLLTLEDMLTETPQENIPVF